MLKFENLANVGDKIRAYDFFRQMDFYVEGTVEAKLTIRDEGNPGFACYRIKCSRDVFEGKDSTGAHTRVGYEVFVPYQCSFLEWDERVMKLAE